MKRNIASHAANELQNQTCHTSLCRVTRDASFIVQLTRQHVIPRGITAHSFDRLSVGTHSEDYVLNALADESSLSTSLGWCGERGMLGHSLEVTAAHGIIFYPISFGGVARSPSLLHCLSSYS